MEREDLLALAQQGNTTAIAALLNQQLKYRGMSCQVVLTNQVLHVVVSAEGETPDRGTTLEFLRAKIVNLDVENLIRVRLYGLAPDAKIDAKIDPSIIPEHSRWTQEFALAVGDYSSLAAALIPTEDDDDPSPQSSIATASTSSTSRRSSKPHRSNRQPNTISLAIVAIALGLIIFSGYKLIARNSRSVPTTPATSDPAPSDPTP
jgi:hypothetical protein